jgi:hypothetical protein
MSLAKLKETSKPGLLGTFSYAPAYPVQQKLEVVE